MHIVVILPELIAQTNMDVQSVRRLREEILQLTNWLARRVDTYFVAVYENTSQEYVDRARGM